MLVRPLLVVVVFAGLLAPSALAQTSTEEAGAEQAGAEQAGAEVPEKPSAYDRFAERFQTDAFRITSLIQVVPRVAIQSAGGDQPRFEIPRARLGIRGRFDGGIGYVLQTELVREVALLDAVVSYGSDDLRASLGLQQTPFSAENLVSDAATDFVDRARIVRRVSPGRSIGAQALVAPGGGPIGLRAGVFNPTQRAATDGASVAIRDRGGALLMGRAETEVRVASGSVALGANAAYNTSDTSPDLESPGKLDLGVDARARFGRVLLAGEWLRSRTEAPYVATAPTGLDGGYVTLGVDLSSRDRALSRLDVIAVEGQEASVDVVLGYNRTLSRVALVQSNLVVPVADAGDGYDLPLQVLFNFQLAF